MAERVWNNEILLNSSGDRRESSFSEISFKNFCCAFSEASVIFELAFRRLLISRMSLHIWKMLNLSFLITSRLGRYVLEHLPDVGVGDDLDEERGVLRARDEFLHEGPGGVGTVQNQILEPRVVFNQEALLLVEGAVDYLLDPDVLQIELVEDLDALQIEGVVEILDEPVVRV